MDPLPDLGELLADVAPLPPRVREPDRKGECDTCGQTRMLRDMGGDFEAAWQCGTCVHWIERMHNCRELWGRGRRGY